MSNYNIGKAILQDTNKNGKDNKWKERKESNLLLADSYQRLGLRKYYRVAECSTFLEFGVTKQESLKLLHANFCKVRLCPMCAWRRSLKIFGQVSKVMDQVDKDYNFKYIFLTLTVKNCYGDELKDTLDHMTQSFNRLNQRKVFKQAVKGYFRALEVTYNRENETYHPHFHMILAVDNSYFTQSKIYLSQNAWTELWQSCLRADYKPIVDVRRLKENNGKEVAEVAKYTVKSDDFLIKDTNGKINEQITDKVVQVLDTSLHGKRLTAFGYIFKEIHNQLKLDDAENDNLVNTDNEDIRDDLTDIILRYQWNIGIKNYALLEVTKKNEES